MNEAERQKYEINRGRAKNLLRGMALSLGEGGIKMIADALEVWQIAARASESSPITCAMCGSNMQKEELGWYCNSCQPRRWAPKASESSPPQTLLEKVTRFADSVSRQERPNSPLWLSACEIYDDILKLRGAAATAPSARPDDIAPLSNEPLAATDWMRQAAQEIVDNGFSFRSENSAVDDAAQIIAKYAGKHVAIDLRRETDSRWLAEVPSIPGCMAYGRTQSEAVIKVGKLLEQVENERQ